MNTKQYAKIAAIAIGAMLILNAVTSLTRILTDPRATHGWADVAFLMAPLLLAMLLAALIYRYSRSLAFDESAPSGINLLEAGIKLLGAYWLVTAVPYMIIALYQIVRLATSATATLAGVVHPLVNGLVYGIAGFCFTRRTEIVEKFVGVGDEA